MRRARLIKWKHFFQTNSNMGLFVSFLVMVSGFTVISYWIRNVKVKNRHELNFEEESMIVYGIILFVGGLISVIKILLT